MDYISKKQIERMVTEKNKNFFSAGAKRFFNSRTLDNGVIVNGFLLFITSEKFDHRSPRNYTVRKFRIKTGDIWTIGEFNHIITIAAARKYLQLEINEILNQKEAI
jgi:hypothetical protein